LAKASPEFYYKIRSFHYIQMPLGQIHAFTPEKIIHIWEVIPECLLIEWYLEASRLFINVKLFIVYSSQSGNL